MSTTFTLRSLKWLLKQDIADLRQHRQPHSLLVMLPPDVMLEARS